MNFCVARAVGKLKKEVDNNFNYDSKEMQLWEWDLVAVRRTNGAPAGALNGNGSENSLRISFVRGRNLHNRRHAAPN